MSEEPEQSAEPVDPAKALLDKLEVILARPTLWTAVGYLHPLKELEIDAEVKALHDQIYPPPPEPEPSEEPAEPQAEASTPQGEPVSEEQPQQSF